MKGDTSECRHVRRDMLRLDELDAVNRGQFDVHLRRCAACRGIAEELSAIESGVGEIDEMDEFSKKAIYAQLVPLVNEVANEVDRKRFPVWLPRPRPVFAFGAALAMAAVVVALAVVRISPDSSTGEEAEQSEFVSSVASADVIHEALIERREGTVHIDTNKDEKSGRFEVKKNTRIVVEQDARFSFRIGDLARIALSGGTDWQLMASTNTYVAINLDRGRLAVEFDGTSGRLLEVTAPVSLLRVKRTIFTVEALSSGETHVGVIEGLVEVVSRRGETQTVEVKDGGLVSVPGDGKLALLTDEQRSLAAELRLMDEYPEELTRLVRFDGSPERVKVQVDGRVLGTTPLTVRLPAGPFTYQLNSPGMEPVAGSVVDRADSKAINYSLLPEEDFEPIAAVENEGEIVSKRGPFRRKRASRKSSSKRGWDLFMRARAAMTAGDIPYAIGLLERAIKGVSGARLVSALSLLAECYSAAGMYSKAASTFDRIVEKSPHSAKAQNARYEVGRLSMDQLGDLARARASFTAYVASPLGGGLKEEAYYSLCELESREGAHRDAMHCFNEFLRAFPGGHHNPDARLRRGAFYQDIDKNWVAAERDLLAFVRARPRHPRTDEARYRVIIGRYQVNDRRGALRMVTEYLRRHPRGQYRLRVERLRRVILDPNFSWELENQ
ncbi:MAG: tetratricopeptide repeat protein [Deltaproteobacteria bacterium]|nr:tetratricopeptide repeat protein [Deltaproteobacteria bacterium]